MTFCSISGRSHRRFISVPRTYFISTMTALCFAGALPAIAQAAKVETLYNFSGGSDGNDPSGKLLRNSAGNLFGVTLGGGDSNDGVVYEISPPSAKQGPWQFTRLYSFSGGADGQEPNDGLIEDASGGLLGITTGGGTAGYGTIFIMTPSKTDQTGYTKTTLYSFSGGSDGSSPYNGLTADGAGNFYGTTNTGGTANAGTIYKLSPPANGGTWTLTTLHEFVATDGTGTPNSALTVGANGILYGSAIAGKGAVYAFDPAGVNGGSLSVIYNFQGLNDGYGPYGGVSLTASGDLVGTTFYAGADAAGAIYQLTPTGSKWHEKTVAYFDGVNCGESDSKLMVAPNGKIFGTAGQPGCIFKLTPKPSGNGYRLSVLNANTDYPTGQLIADKHGNVFGVNQVGPYGYGFGQVYKLPGVAGH
jgi:uncharacterized repeat protein (TIGR03803 family)